VFCVLQEREKRSYLRSSFDSINVMSLWYCCPFFFLHVRTRGGIRTSDIYFIKRGPSRFNYLLGTVLLSLIRIKSLFLGEMISSFCVYSI
jgi:hypothetical protein